MNADGSHIRHITRAGRKIQPAFTPDGRHLVYECDCDPQGIVIMRTDGTERRRLSTNPFPDEGDGDPNVSPDGETGTFVRHKVDGELQALFAVNVDGTHERRLVGYSREVAIKHDWAPDGHHIAITTAADYPNGRSPNVATVRPDGSHLRFLTYYQGGVRGPSSAPTLLTAGGSCSASRTSKTRNTACTRSTPTAPTRRSSEHCPSPPGAATGAANRTEARRTSPTLQRCQVSCRWPGMSR